VSSGSELGQRVSSLLTAGEEPDQSVKDRLALWEAARHMATDHPLTGIGPRAFPDHRDAYADLSLLGSSDISFGSDFQRVALNSPHDLYLLIASEQGLVAALAYVTVFAVLLVRSLIVAARRRSDATTALALVAAGMFTYELIISISGDLGGPGSIFVALSVGLAARAAADIDLTDDTSALADHGHRDAVLLPAPQPQELQA
jgi:O-antigen ligase